MPEREPTIGEADRERVIWAIASELDMPSVYMGGPSPPSRRRATAIVDQLQTLGYVLIRANGMADCGVCRLRGVFMEMDSACPVHVEEEW